MLVVLHAALLKVMISRGEEKRQGDEGTRGLGGEEGGKRGEERKRGRGGGRGNDLSKPFNHHSNVSPST